MIKFGITVAVITVGLFIAPNTGSNRSGCWETRSLHRTVIDHSWNLCVSFCCEASNSLCNTQKHCDNYVFRNVKKYKTCCQIVQGGYFVTSLTRKTD